MTPGSGLQSSRCLSLFSSRYPHANDFSGARGDLINTAGFRFNAPFPYKEDDYVAEGRLQPEREDEVVRERRHRYQNNRHAAAIRFPGDPPTALSSTRAIPGLWGTSGPSATPRSTRLSYGEAYRELQLSQHLQSHWRHAISKPLAGTVSGGAILASPYSQCHQRQGRTYPIPVIRDDFSWQKGTHSFTFGGTFKCSAPKGLYDPQLQQSDDRLGRKHCRIWTPSFRPQTSVPRAILTADIAPAVIRQLRLPWPLLLTRRSAALSTTMRREIRFPKARAKPGPIATMKRSFISGTPGR